MGYSISGFFHWLKSPIETGFTFTFKHVFTIF